MYIDLFKHFSIDIQLHVCYIQFDSDKFGNLKSDTVYGFVLKLNKEHLTARERSE
jgi:hypothetical protein